jgi:hypothetical protein
MKTQTRVRESIIGAAQKNSSPQNQPAPETAAPAASPAPGAAVNGSPCGKSSGGYPMLELEDAVTKSVALLEIQAALILAHSECQQTGLVTEPLPLSIPAATGLNMLSQDTAKALLEAWDRFTDNIRSQRELARAQGGAQ